MWVHRLGPEKAKRMMFTGDKISGVRGRRDRARFEIRT